MCFYILGEVDIDCIVMALYNLIIRGSTHYYAIAPRGSWVLVL